MIDLKMPPADCPNDGLCVKIVGRVHEAEKDIERHGAALTRIGTDLDGVKRELHGINVMLRERDSTMGFLKTVFVSILAVGTLQLAASVWWAATITATTEQAIEHVSDLEMRMRARESAR
jgi:hypothetical protein